MAKLPNGEIDSFSNYTGAVVYCRTGASSCMLLKGTGGTIIAAITGVDYSELKGWFNHRSGSSSTYAYRNVLHETTQIRFYDNRYLSYSGDRNDGSWTVWGVGTEKGHPRVTISPYFSYDNSFNIPYRIFGIRYGVLPN